ncbi:MAG: hypothetical protein IJW37_09685 [Lachnospiraceae bacterium]|nr:hypothetical protein [Lachnospiraceae bacterium]
MKQINYIKQPTDYLCGQACVAMLAGVAVEEVVSVMKNDKGTGKKDIEKALNYYGVSQAKTMTKADNYFHYTFPPKSGIISLRERKEWSG